MNTVHHSKGSNSRQLPKRSFQFWYNRLLKLIPTIFLASLLGTYLDLYFVGRGFYSFPNRPFPAIFSINITFTLLGLPLLISVFLYICKKINFLQKIGFILLTSLLMSVAEKLSETYGFFAHHATWQHGYTFGGYIIFYTIIYLFYEKSTASQ